MGFKRWNRSCWTLIYRSVNHKESWMEYKVMFCFLSLTYSLFQVGDLEIFLTMIQSSGAYTQTSLAVQEGSSNRHSVVFDKWKLWNEMGYWVIELLTYYAAFSILLHRCILPISCHWHLSEILPRYCTAALHRWQLINCRSIMEH